LRILLVDDHEGFRRALRFLLSWHKVGSYVVQLLTGSKLPSAGCRAQADSAGLSLLTTNDAGKMNRETVRRLEKDATGASLLKTGKRKFAMPS
jgi:DNA-binding NarL/FixJ family response regulator